MIHDMATYFYNGEDGFLYTTYSGHNSIINFDALSQSAIEQTLKNPQSLTTGVIQVMDPDEASLVMERWYVVNKNIVSKEEFRHYELVCELSGVNG